MAASKSRALVRNTPAETGAGTAGLAPAAYGPKTLAIDIGGTNLKAGLLDSAGTMIGERVRIPTMHPSQPDRVVPALVGLAGRLGAFDRISIGFPGVICDGVVKTAPNLGTEAWAGFDLAAAMQTHLGKPARVLNDATVQGLGVISGHGLECVITLGTGFGFALYQDGRLTPHLELSQHIARKTMTYDEYLGVEALYRVGRKHWRRRVQRILVQLRVLVGFDVLYIGGGDAEALKMKLPSDIRIVSNNAGITGGVRLWDSHLDEAFTTTGRCCGSARSRAT